VPFHDPIVEEVRAAREAHAARFNHDLDAIIADFKRRQKESGRKVLSYPSKTAGKKRAPNHPGKRAS